MGETAKEPLRGERLLKAVVNQILQHPDTWEQGSWHSDCGTKHCIAGWCQILGGRKSNSDTARQDATDLLGITGREADILFSSEAALAVAHYFATHFREGGYNRDGYNRDGYNRDGYNRDGYNRDGYDRAGYNRDGYDRAGYNRAGYNRDGYSRYGYDRAGYDRAGYDRAGKKLPLFDI